MLGIFEEGSGFEKTHTEWNGVAVGKIIETSWVHDRAKYLEHEKGFDGKESGVYQSSE